MNVSGKHFRTIWVKADDLGVVQEPECAPVRYAGHESGDFLFLPR